jgi:hypothetical protein
MPLVIASWVPASAPTLMDESVANQGDRGSGNDDVAYQRGAALIARSTASLGQQSTLSPADF